MYQFYKSIKQLAETNGKEYTSIKDLTIDIAKSGNYRREMVTLKNGSTVERTKYGVVDPVTGKRKGCWDDSLVAKWFLFYKKMFFSQILRHPELKEYYVDILQKTFTIYFQSLRIDKINCDQAVTFAVNKVLHNRITYHIRLLGSVSREEKMRNAELVKKGLLNKEDLNPNDIARKRIETYSTMVRRNTISLNELMDSEDNSGLAEKFMKDNNSDISELNPILIDINKKLEGRRFGSRLLQAMLYTDRRLSTSNLNAYMEFTKEEAEDPETLKEIKEDYLTIRKILIEYLPDSCINIINKYPRMAKVRKFKISKGKKEEVLGATV